jgi:PAS domain S-box-containing protein
MESILLRESRQATAPARHATAPDPGVVAPPASAAVSRPPEAPRTSPTERRLKLIIETAPVGVMLTDPSGRVLAANRMALSQLGVDRLDGVLGKNFAEFAPEKSAAIAAFVDQVGKGTAGSFEFVVAHGSERRTIEMHGTPIRKGEESDATAVLAATWDVTDRTRARAELESRCDLVEFERNTLKEALAQAQPLNQWAAEREALTAQLSDADRQITLLMAEHGAERERGRAALEEAERANQAALTRAEEERTKLEAELGRVRERHDAALAASRAEHDRLSQTIHELTASHADLVSRHAAERADVEVALQAERRRCGQLLDEQRAWRAALADAVRSTNESARRIQRLLDEGPNAATAGTGDRGSEAADDVAHELPPPGAADTHHESSWQF